MSNHQETRFTDTEMKLEKLKNRDFGTSPFYTRTGPIKSIHHVESLSISYMEHPTFFDLYQFNKDMFRLNFESKMAIL